MEKKPITAILIIAGAIVVSGCIIAGAIIIPPLLKQSDENTEEDSDTSDEDTTDTEEDNDTDTDTDDDTNTSEKFAVVVAGESNDTLHYGWFRDSSHQAYEMLLTQGYTDQNIYYLFESADEPDVDMESTLDNFISVLETLASESDANDQVVMILIGHGGYQGGHSFYSLSDDLIEDTEMANLLADISRDKLIVVFSPCNTGGFIDDLSDENTIVISSTRPDESNRAAFIEPFLSAFSGVGDTDGDTLVSVGEAFNYAVDSVLQQYETNGWGALTEHAQLDDNGDGVSHEAPIPNQGDGQLSLTTFL